MEIIPSPREFVGRLFFFPEPLQLPYGRGWGPGIHTKTSHGGAEISVQMPDPGTTLKLHFIVICG